MTGSLVRENRYLFSAIADKVQFNWNFIVMRSGGMKSALDLPLTTLVQIINMEFGFSSSKIVISREVNTPETLNTQCTGFGCNLFKFYALSILILKSIYPKPPQVGDDDMLIRAHGSTATR